MVFCMVRHDESLTDVTAAILAGGLGSRLRPVVRDRPKVLAPVLDRPYLTYLLDRLADVSVRRVVLLTGYLADQVRGALGESYRGMRLVYSVEPAPLGTGGALQRALPYLDSQRILVMNGDSWCDVSLVDFDACHRRRAARLSMVISPCADGARFGQVQVAANGRVLRFAEKRATGGGWINAGIYLVERGLIEEIPEELPLSLERDLLPEWLARGERVHGHCCTGRFIDIGTPESYAEAASFFHGPAHS
jgi:D-glycero-alpha-D-manno-heptose 1-phosphate guanylyltransferase